MITLFEIRFEKEYKIMEINTNQTIKERLFSHGIYRDVIIEIHQETLFKKNKLYIVNEKEIDDFITEF